MEQQSSSIFFIVELEVKPGQVDELRSVMDEMVNLVRANEPGTMNYEWFLNADGTACYIFERYAEPAALLLHTASFPQQLSQRSQAFRPIRLTAYGKLTEELRAKKIEPLLRAVPGISVVLLERGSGVER